MTENPRFWTLSRFADGWVCKAIGPASSSSCIERIEVMERIPLCLMTWPGHDQQASTMAKVLGDDG